MLKTTRLADAALPEGVAVEPSPAGAADETIVDPGARPGQSRVRLNRRAMLLSGAVGAVGAVGVPGAIPSAAAQPVEERGRPAYDSRANAASIRRAVGFLQSALDAYRSTGARGMQSYQDGSGLGDIGFTYDNALSLLALLAAKDVGRARALGDAMIYAQLHDPEYDDYRLRQAYHVDEARQPGGVVNIGSDFGLTGTAVGDMSWAGIALAQLANRTGERSYRDAATRIAEWIVDSAYSDSGLGGFTFGETAGLEDHKSTEHNIDVYGFFTLLAQLSRRPVWNERARHAWDFVTKLWNAEDGFFWTGSDDGTSINVNAKQLPLDPQTWSWLAAGRPQYRGCLDWAASHLATTDTPLRPNSNLRGNYSVTGVTFASGAFLADASQNIGGQDFNPKPDTSAVWFEGTAQLALALNDRRSRTDRERAGRLFEALESAQADLGRKQTFGGNRIGGGIVAASSALDTGFGFGYYPNLHTGATAWYVMAGLAANPFEFFA